ncbi:unnamed protein product [Peronospora farinosa]|uniref:Uncharacterized protein n=1 Tax=Peronospora farinosa TaxID=134698 RepID=A0AAV0TT87_9STRA|nr:unnamed protein product [Peronospora farinosa]CAI5727088.1 unnamed protein product [Peronospora farinosa]
MAEYSEIAHKHLANAPGSIVNDIYPAHSPQMHMQAPSQYPVRFQELPRLHVPPFALTQQSIPTWKMSQQSVPRMSVSNLLSGSFRSRAIPQPQAPRLTVTPPSPPTLRRLPSFADILARTHLLHFMGRSSVPTETPTSTIEASMEDDMQMQPEKMITPMYQQQISMQLMENSYTTFAPPCLDTNLNMDTSINMTDELQSPMGVTSPVSQTSETNKRRERWTEEEHACFMEGLNRYGRKWKKIQTFVKTKTAVQVRTHAYGYFAKLLRNMPEDDAIWDLAEEMSSLPGAVLKGPGNSKRRNEPKTDEAGMEVLRRFVFSKKKSEDKKQLLASNETTEDHENVEMADSTPSNANSQAPTGLWSSTQLWKADDSDAMLEIKRQRLN